MKIFVDLEKTLVENFNNWVYCTDKIARLRSVFGRDEMLNIELFSYAMWCDDNANFVRSKNEEFNDLFKINITKIIQTDEMYGTLIHHKKLTRNDAEAARLVWLEGKQSMFKIYVNHGLGLFARIRDFQFLLHLAWLPAKNVGDFFGSNLLKCIKI